MKKRIPGHKVSKRNRIHKNKKKYTRKTKTRKEDV